MSIMGGLFGKKTAERPAGAEPSQACRNTDVKRPLRRPPRGADGAWSQKASLQQQGLPQEAIRKDQSAAGKPDDAQAHLAWAGLRRQFRLEEAIREFQAALRAKPDNAEAYIVLGMVYRKQGRTDEAIRAYQAALRINPDDAEAHLNLGVVTVTGPHRRGDPGVSGHATDEPRFCCSTRQPG